MSWKCFFGHNWVYSDKTEFIVKFTGESVYRYVRRRCLKCNKEYEANHFRSDIIEPEYYSCTWTRVK